MTDTIRTVQIVWQSPCKTAHVEEKRGIYWGWIGVDHVCTQMSVEAAVKVIKRKIKEREGK